MISRKQPPALAPDERCCRAGAPKQVRCTNRALRAALRANRSVDLWVRVNSGLTFPPLAPSSPPLPSVATFCPHLWSTPSPSLSILSRNQFQGARPPSPGRPAAGTLPRPSAGFPSGSGPASPCSPERSNTEPSLLPAPATPLRTRVPGEDAEALGDPASSLRGAAAPASVRTAQRACRPQNQASCSQLVPGDPQAPLSAGTSLAGSRGPPRPLRANCPGAHLAGHPAAAGHLRAGAESWRLRFGERKGRE